MRRIEQCKIRFANVAFSLKHTHFELKGKGELRITNIVRPTTQQPKLLVNTRGTKPALKCGALLHF